MWQGGTVSVLALSERHRVYWMRPVVGGHHIWDKVVGNHGHSQEDRRADNSVGVNVRY
jgi:hypothetical protein